MEVGSQRRRAAARARVATLLSILALPFLAGLFAGADVPVGDDWKLFIGFDRLSFTEALRVNSAAHEGYRFRPFLNGVVWCERRILGLGFGGEAVVGRLWIGLCGLALYGLLRRLGCGRSRAWAAAALFLLHPTSAEIHGWASSRDSIMSAGLGLLALYCGLGRGVRAGVAAFFLLAAACLSKETSYPLALGLPLLLALVRPGGFGRYLSGPAALAGALGAKRAALGRAIAEWWLIPIPLLARLRGWALLALPLLLFPLGSGAAAPGFARWLAYAYPALVVLGLTLGLWAGFPDRRWALAFALLLGLSAAVTGGVPPHADLGGGREWFLPAAFLCALVARYCDRRMLCAVVPLGAVLLALNLAPWRRAKAEMAAVLDRLAVEVPARRRAVLATGLEPLHGPVPLFFLMTEHYMRRFDGPLYDRPLLLLAPRNEGERRVQARLIQDWKAYMRARGRPILELRWDARAHALVETSR